MCGHCKRQSEFCLGELTAFIARALKRSTKIKDLLKFKRGGMYTNY